MGIRPDDVQYIELYNEYNKLHTNGEKVSYIVAICVQCNQGFLPLKANSPTLPLYRNKQHSYHEQILSNLRQGAFIRKDAKQ